MFDSVFLDLLKWPVVSLPSCTGISWLPKWERPQVVSKTHCRVSTRSHTRFPSHSGTVKHNQPFKCLSPPPLVNSFLSHLQPSPFLTFLCPPTTSAPNHHHHPTHATTSPHPHAYHTSAMSFPNVTGPQGGPGPWMGYHQQHGHPTPPPQAPPQPENSAVQTRPMGRKLTASFPR